MYPEARPTGMVRYCTLCRDSVAHFRATHTSPGESSHALCVPSDGKTAITLETSRPQKKKF